MKIHLFNTQSDLKIKPTEARKIVRHVLALQGQTCDELALHFVDQSTICKLHDEHFGDPSLTDCISFPMDDPDESGYVVLGEVFVCPATAIEYAKKRGADPYLETTLYIVHGILHLLGYDDLESSDRRKMRRAERECLKSLKENGLGLTISSANKGQ